MKNSTLRSRLLLGFAAITVPLLIFLVYNNWYAMSVVCDQVANSNQNILQVYVNQVDGMLKDLDKYMQNMAYQNNDLISLDSYPEDSMEAYLAKIRIINQMNKDILLYEYADSIFVYKPASEELLVSLQLQSDGSKIKSKLPEMLSDPDKRTEMTLKWTLLNVDGQYAMLKLNDTGYGRLMGVWITLDNLLTPIRFIEFNGNFQVLFSSPAGLVLTKNAFGEPSQTVRNVDFVNTFKETGRAYSILKNGSGISDSMVISRRSDISELYLVVLLPVDSLLQKLTFFQRIVYATPIITAIFLAGFRFYLQKSVGSPVRKLVRGMKKIQSGDLTARLEPTHLTEFNSINDAFNDMAKQIINLKVDVYEEKLSVQKAEMKHLQAQIHPHFFANCLNLIYNLAQVKNTDLVKDMALHLVKHFRFMTRTGMTLVRLSEELEHIRNYLCIQKIRFPVALDYNIEMEPDIETFMIPPLILQPFVENAIEHGFCYRGDAPFSIRVEATRKTGGPHSQIIVKIEDNGKGFDPDTLSMLQSGAYFGENSEDHIGIWNVQRRCQLYYESKAAITYKNGPQGGAVVELTLPAA